MVISADLFNSDELQGWALGNVAEGSCEISGSRDHLIDTLLLSEFFGALFSVFEEDGKGRSLWQAVQDDWNLVKDNRQAEIVIERILDELNLPLSAKTNVGYIAEVIEPCSRWKDIKSSLRTERRFFAGDLIQDDDKWDVFFASNITIKAGTIFKRARINEDDKKLYSEEKDLGMPPADKATAGRANTYGIPYLYLGEDDLTVMYESRALVNDILSVATFETTRDLDVVDFTAKPDLFAVFQQSKDDLITAIQRYVFLSEVSKDMSKAVRRYDNKEIDYLSTQFVCEYIRLVTAAKGLVFQSAQYPEGKNTVLFDDKNVKFLGVVHKEVGSVTMTYSR